MKGKVLFYNDFKGFGFCKGEDNQEYFIHVSEIRTPGFRTVYEQQHVEFTPGKNGRGLIAREIIPMEEYPQVQKSPSQNGGYSTTLVLKTNPFRPQDPMIDPRKFVGRRDSLINSVDALYNGKNILIDGYRGIGKSSLAMQLLYIAQGETELLDRFGIKLGDNSFDRLTGDFRCLPGNSLPEIVDGLLATLSRNANKNRDKKPSTRTFSVDTRVLGYKNELTSQPISPSDLSVYFTAEVKEILGDYKYGAQGITFLIDEIDVLEDKIELAPFLKATTEKFRLDSYFSVNFVVSGVTETATKLIIQHQSSERLFEHLEIPRMTVQELCEIVEVALKDTGITITSDAKLKVATLGNDFPQPVHLLGYHSFRLNSDSVIDNLDVGKAIEFITTNVRRQHFQGKFEKIGAGIETEVVRAMASAPYATVNIAFLSQRLPDRSDEKILGALGNLEKIEVVEKPSRAQYRFCEPLFKVYLRMLFKIS